MEKGHTCAREHCKKKNNLGYSKAGSRDRVTSKPFPPLVRRKSPAVYTVQCTHTYLQRRWRGGRGGEPMDQLKGQSGNKHCTMWGGQRNGQQRGHKLGGEGGEWLQREIGEKHRRSRIYTYSFKVWLVFEDTLKFALSHIYGPQHSTRNPASISWYNTQPYPFT